MAESAAAPLDVVAVVSSVGHDLTPLIDHLHVTDPTARLHAVWAGDPYRRPVLPGRMRWADLDLAEPSAVGWGRLLTALSPPAYGWARAACAGSRLFESGSHRLVVLHGGSTLVAGSLGDWVADRGVTAIERVAGPPAVDGLAPSSTDLARRGRWSPGVLGFASDAGEILSELGDLAAAAEPIIDIGAVFATCLSRHADRVVVPRSGVAAGWSSSDGPPTVIDVADLDPNAAWHVTFGSVPSRERFSDDLELADAIAAALGQRHVDADPVVLPGGLEVDATVRSLMRESIDAYRRGDGPLPPEPFESGGLVPWLESGSARSGGSIGRYWFEEWVGRPDLHASFADPTGDDRARFLEWARSSWATDGRSAFLRANDDGHGAAWSDGGRTPGINVIGYVGADSGLGDYTRRLYWSLAAAEVPTTALDYHRYSSPPSAETPPLSTTVEHATNLITVHTDQMTYFADDHGAEVFPDRLNVGYWFWELSELTPRLVSNVDFVDEVWAATEFVAGAFRRVTDKPVRTVPVPVPEPLRSDATRADLGLPDDRFVFLVTFDHLSITDRKNPLAAIRAFEHAFPGPAGPVLVVKTLNAHLRWQEHEELQLAASRRPDITVVDRHVDRADQMRLIELADCLVSLHRSEGLGLHLQEAMWLDTAVIATRYSGNLDFMNDDNSVLVDAELVPVWDAQGYYPGHAVWADPDLDQAAAAMVKVVEDSAYRSTIAARARADMLGQRSLAETGHVIAELSGALRPNPNRQGVA